MKRTRLAVLLVVALAPAVFADQVTLKNGDRLSGTIITSDAKTLVLKTEYADAVTIKWDFVQQVESGQPLYIRTKAGQVIPGSVTTSGDKLDVATKESGSVAVAKADVTSLRNADEEKKAEAALERLQHPRLADSWTGSLDTGLGLVRGNSESSNFTFGLNAARATTRDKITYYTVSAFARSTVNGVAGGGRHAIKNDHTSLDLLVGATFNRESFTTFNRSSGEVVLGETFTHKFFASSTLNEALFFYPNLTSLARSCASFLRFPLPAARRAQQVGSARCTVAMAPHRLLAYGFQANIPPIVSGAMDQEVSPLSQTLLTCEVQTDINTNDRQDPKLS